MKMQALFAKIASLSLLGLSLMSQVVWAQGSGGKQPSFVPGRILVKFKDGVSDGQARGLLAGRNALSTNVIPQLGVHIVQLPPNANEQAEANAFKGLADVEFAQLDQLVAPSSLNANDPYYSSNWHFFKISAPSAWSVTTGSSSVVIAIVDTGIDVTHQDLIPKLVSGWNVVDGNNNTNDISNHGTESAGIAAEASNNGLGSAGICWGCMLMPVRVTDDTYGFAASSDVANGIIWAADHGARVAAVGYALSDDATATAAAQYFYNKGGVVVMPSGNLGSFDATADNPYVVTVGATDNIDAIYSFSSTGNNIDLVAPGCISITAAPINGYASDCGTSAAAAVVAGVVGLIRSVNPALTPAQVTGIVDQSVDDLGTTGWDSTYGWGRINALKAVNNASTAGGPPPAPVINSSLNATGTQNSAFSYQITATNTPTSYGATGLPSGLAVNTATGAITGTPTVSGPFSITIKATNSGGTGSATLALTINAAAPSAPVITSALSATGTQNSAFGYQITATNSPTSFNAAGLPSGLGVNTATGAITGTPTVSGPFNVTISATNSGGTGSATLALTINAAAPPAPVITSAMNATGTQNSAFGYQITATNSPTSFNATGLPSGLGVNTTTGAITGTPTVSGAFSVTISATNSGGTGSATLALTINAAAPSAPVITSAMNATGTQNSAFGYQITATNNPTSYGASGLPSGLTVNTASGMISGTPTASGTFNVTVSATNSGGTGSAFPAFTITTAPPAAPVITSSLSATGTQNTAFGYQITATNGPTSFGASGLPSGLFVNTSSGVISGTPAVSGSFSVTISATNSGGTGFATLALTINPNAPPPPDFSISASPGNVNMKSGGTAQYTINVTGLNGFSDSVNFSVSGAGGSFSPASVTGSGSTILSVSAPRGSYLLTITATSGSGTVVHAISVSLRVH